MKRAGLGEVREVRRGVAQAGDEQLLQVVRVVDALVERGESDAVLVPVRARLRLIHPSRPLRFVRLLFLPADPLIAGPGAWRADGVFLPRQGLGVLAGAVRAWMAGPGGMQMMLGEIDAMIQTATTAQTDVVRHAGGLLWPVAARAMREIGGLEGEMGDVACFAGWAALGLPPDELPQLTLGFAGVLGAASWLYARLQDGGCPTDEAVVERLAETERLGKRAWGMMLHLLMIRAPACCGALLAAAQAKAGHRQMAGLAADAALGWVEAETAAKPDLLDPDAPRELNSQACVLASLSEQPGDAAQKRRLLVARTALVERSVQRFQVTLRDNLAVPLQVLPSEACARDAALDAMEDAARLLRAFELEARRLGGGPALDAAVAGAEQIVKEADGLSRMDKARLLELIAGPEAALQLLTG